MSDLAKEIVKAWKNAVEKEKQGSGNKLATSSAASAPAPAPAAKPPGMSRLSCEPRLLFTSRSKVRKLSIATTSQSGTPQPATPTSAKAEARTYKGDGVKSNLGDNIRDKCVELLYDALAYDSGARKLPCDFAIGYSFSRHISAIEQILNKAKGIESTIFGEHGGTIPPYRAKIRSLFVNLKDKNNPSLRETIVAGDLPVARFCKMTSAEMASEERQAADKKIQEENLFKTLGAEEVQAETDAFQCGRCKQVSVDMFWIAVGILILGKRKCRYRQAQTRSADEPMTVSTFRMRSTTFVNTLIFRRLS